MRIESCRTATVLEENKMDITKEELINDLSRVFKEQNDIIALSDDALIEAWKRHGVHAGTWDWDEIIIEEE